MNKEDKEKFFTEISSLGIKRSELLKRIGQPDITALQFTNLLCSQFSCLDLITYIETRYPHVPPPNEVELSDGNQSIWIRWTYPSDKMIPKAELTVSIFRDIAEVDFDFFYTTLFGKSNSAESWEGSLFPIGVILEQALVWLEQEYSRPVEIDQPKKLSIKDKIMKFLKRKS